MDINPTWMLINAVILFRVCPRSATHVNMNDVSIIYVLLSVRSRTSSTGPLTRLPCRLTNYLPGSGQHAPSLNRLYTSSHSFMTPRSQLTRFVIDTTQSPLAAGTHVGRKVSVA